LTTREEKALKKIKKKGFFNTFKKVNIDNGWYY